ncbi:hypothetical protein EWM64_g4513 [Hericium alpestre]|uniref:Cytochrome P450 n=1 Tax=Hericium alpestre TaxID=135208 RepID=A0A4Z0A199_9AGAM|nr:hypothetical protein EWM64_g4513 [Hericium alpestre]
MSLFLGHTPVIGTAQAAWDLLEKRSDVYSSRPRFIVAGEILSDNQRGLMMPAGEGWRKFRRVYHAGFHSRKSNTYRDIQSLESKLLMHQLSHEPEGYEGHIKRYAASVVVSVSYGKRIDSVDEFIVKENMNSMASCDLLTDAWDPGTCPPCWSATVLAENDKLGLDDTGLAYTLSSPFGAGIETTSATLFVFIREELHSGPASFWLTESVPVAMVHFPEAMCKAQAELDTVVGQDRMPEFQDAENLPYVRALINEVLRWRPVAVLGGTPHASTADDEYNGMFIPKGSTVFANLDGIMRDPETFPNPEAFLPERWLPGSALCSTHPRLQLDTFDLPFGFGRRICPGQHLASNSIFINTARMLWAFDILPKKDAPLPDPWAFTDGFNSWPMSFECRIEVRSARIRDCIEREWETAKEALEKWQ